MAGMKSRGWGAGQRGQEGVGQRGQWGLGQRTSLMNCTTLLRWQSCIIPGGGASRQRGSGISDGCAVRIRISRCVARSMPAGRCEHRLEGSSGSEGPSLGGLSHTLDQMHGQVSFLSSSAALDGKRDDRLYGRG